MLRHVWSAIAAVAIAITHGTLAESKSRAAGCRRTPAGESLPQAERSPESVAAPDRALDLHFILSPLPFAASTPPCRLPATPCAQSARRSHLARSTCDSPLRLHSRYRVLPTRHTFVSRIDAAAHADIHTSDQVVAQRMAHHLLGVRGWHTYYFCTPEEVAGIKPF